MIHRSLSGYRPTVFGFTAKEVFLLVRMLVPWASCPVGRTQRVVAVMHLAHMHPEAVHPRHTAAALPTRRPVGIRPNSRIRLSMILRIKSTDFVSPSNCPAFLTESEH